jgi:FkbM family methyltransferase
MSIANLYQMLVPLAIRRPLWHARSLTGKILSLNWRGEWRRAQVDRLLQQAEPIARIKLGSIHMVVDLRDIGVGRPLYMQRRYEPCETSLLTKLLLPGQTFIDVGANIGYFSILAAKKVGSSGRVLAIEPEPHNFELLSQNVKINQLCNVTLANVALGESPGTAQLFCSPQNFGDHRLYADADSGDRQAVNATMVRLDDLIDQYGLTSVDLIKMDVQGYECYVLAGMRRLLGTNRRLRVLTEFWPFGMRHAGSDPAWFFATFEQFGYVARVITKKGLGPVVTCEQAHSLLPEFDPQSPDHCNVNLLFQKQDT